MVHLEPKLFAPDNESEPIIYGKNYEEELKPYELPALTDDQKFVLERAKKYALDQSIQSALSKQVAQLQNQDINSIKRNQAIVLISRIYVGSINFEVGEDEIRKVFSPFGPLKTVTMSWDGTMQKHKGFAFIEYERPEAAILALETMNGYVVGGRGIKVGRPSNAPQTTELENQLKMEPENCKRLYIANVHKELDSADLKTVFEAFGPVIKCFLMPDMRGQFKHAGYGFIEFTEEEAVVGAVQSMNRFELAGQALRVTRALTPIEFDASINSTMSINTAAAVQKATEVSNSISQVLSSLGDDVCVGKGGVIKPSSKFSSKPAETVPPPGVVVPTINADPPIPRLNNHTSPPKSPHKPASKEAIWKEEEAKTTMMEAPPNEVPPNHQKEIDVPVPEVSQAADQSNEEPALSMSSVLLLENMVTLEEVDEYLEEEVQEECNKYGYVIRVLVHTTPPSTTGEVQQGVGGVRIFVQFDSHEDASHAQTVFHGRMFGGRPVSASLFDSERFQMRQLDD